MLFYTKPLASMDSINEELMIKDNAFIASD